jgi:hypothetical protein
VNGSTREGAREREEELNECEEEKKLQFSFSYLRMKN